MDLGALTNELATVHQRYPHPVVDLWHSQSQVEGQRNAGHDRARLWRLPSKQQKRGVTYVTGLVIHVSSACDVNLKVMERWRGHTHHLARLVRHGGGELLQRSFSKVSKIGSGYG